MTYIAHSCTKQLFLKKGQIILKNSKEIGLDIDSNLMLNTVN